MAKKAKPRDTYKYEVKKGRKVILRGATNDLDRRGTEHKVRYPDSHIAKVGRKTTREQALKWAREHRKAK
ncbi:MAG: hypothetical protein WC566_11280 [Dehalococcoidia bacterium]